MAAVQALFRLLASMAALFATTEAIVRLVRFAWTLVLKVLKGNRKQKVQFAGMTI